MKIFFQITLNKVLNPQYWCFCKWIKWCSVYIKSINGLSSGKWALTQTQASKPKNFLIEKLRRFFILHYVLIRALFWKPISKAPWQISCCFINIWGTFESNYYQGKQSYRTVTKFAKNSAETGFNNHVKSFSETTFRLCWHDLWWNLQWKVLPEPWVYSIQRLSSPIRSYYSVIKRENLPWIRLQIPPTLTLVQETLLVLKHFQWK